MMKKIIFFLESPFNQRDYKRFGVERLGRNGFTVEVWDLSPVFYPKLDLTPPDPFAFGGLRVFADRKDVVAACARLSSRDMIITWFVYPRFLWLYRAISRSQARYSALLLVTVPPSLDAAGTLPSKKNLWDRLCAVGVEHRWQGTKILGRILDKLILAVPYKWLGIKPITFWFAATAHARRSHRFPCDRTTQDVFVHVYDHDLYLESKEQAFAKVENDAVFLDVYLPFHPDNDICGTPYAIKAENYYPTLCRFFDQVENEQGGKVAIAAHPRSHYEEHPDYFDQRVVQRGKTVEMVRDARFVITHDSASFNYAIMFFKPMIFIVTDEMVRHNVCGMVYNMASWFGKVPINIDQPFVLDWQKELMVDQETYERYIHTFIKMKGTEPRNTWEIVSAKFKELDP